MTDETTIVVGIKQVPDDDEVRIDPDTGRLDRASAPAIMNRPDRNALEAALSLRDQAGGEVLAMTMGPPTATEVLEAAVAMGCDDAALISDRKFAGSDTWPTSLTLAAAAEALDADVVLLDTSAGLSHDSVEPLRVADEVVLVSTAERGAIGDTAKTREVADRFGTPVTGVVVTRTGTETDAASVGDRLGVAVLGSIPDDPAVAAAAADGKPLVTAAPSSPATAAYRRLAAALTGDDSITVTTDEPTSPTGPEDVVDAEAIAGDDGGSADWDGVTGETGTVTLDDGATDEGGMDDGVAAADDESDDGSAAVDHESSEGSAAVDDDSDDGDERTGFLRWLLG